MKKILVLLGILFLAAAGWVTWMSYLNTRTATTQIYIDGSVDEVLIYQTTQPEAPLIRIPTNGKDTVRRIELKTAQTFSPFIQSQPARYSFAIVTGNRITRGSQFCCETGLHTDNGTLVINGASNWNYSGFSAVKLP